MSELDESLYAAAKLREHRDNRLRGESLLLEHSGLVDDPNHRSALTFLAQTLDVPLTSTKLGKMILSTYETDVASEAVQDSQSVPMSFMTGITENELDASSIRLPLVLNDQIENHEMPAYITIAGNPESGKTNTAWLMVEIRDYFLDDLMVLSNSRSSDRVDKVCMSARDLMIACLDNRDKPKAIVVDEGSTHFDAVRHRSEVRNQWGPMAKRFAKVGVDFAVAIGHTGKDIHPELKRMTSTAVWKHSKTECELFGRWQADMDRPVDSLLGGRIVNLQPTSVGYDPDEPSPWDWNLDTDVFSRDYDWDELLHELMRKSDV